jgi:sugar lactone lactonase YvrE
MERVTRETANEAAHLVQRRKAMRTRYWFARMMGASFVVFGFVACTGASETIAPSTSAAAVVRSAFAARDSMRYDGKSALLFVVNSSNNTIEVYDPNLNDPSPIAAITEGVVTPSADCLDKSETLYVVDGEHDRIPEYRKGQSAPYQVITAGLNSPSFCAVDGAGNLWVTNTSGHNVTKYPKGSTNPSTVIRKGIMYPIGLAFNRKDDMFVACRPGGSDDNVQVYPPGGMTPSMTITDGITEPAGIAVDARGTLYVANLAFDTIAEYKAGQHSPYQTITNGTDYPVAVTVDKKGTLFVSNLLSNNIVEYAPGSVDPSGYTISQSIDGPEGTAYSPPVLPKE